MIRTILILIFTIIILPIIAFYSDAPLNELQQSTLHVLLTIMVGTALFAFLLGEITRNTSQVDKIWSIMPIIYVWYIAFASGWNERLVLMAIPVTLWGARLTYNFSRRGAYKLKFWEGEEDYRWEVLRKNPALSGRWRWMFFNLFFICLYQMTLILLFMLPALLAMEGVNEPLGSMDFLLTVIMAGLVIIETIADQQQWNFQTEKHRRLNAGEKLTPPYDKGFVHTGLWKMVRHPNYTCEQAIWVVFYFFSVSATGRWINWSLAGAMLLLILFKGSSDFSEGISAEKYPEYKNYQKKTPRFIPFLKF
jgi:steroid 5-alpha reductase family enzyme